MYLLGLDIGTSSIKASLLNPENGVCVASSCSPETEMSILAPAAGWAEQEPEQWWKHTCLAVSKVIGHARVNAEDIAAIGIAYQMHGLVCVNDRLEVLRNAIIWCDSRAVETGNQAFDAIGHDRCLEHHLNQPGNFTASKLGWVKAHEPEVFRRIHKIMLPGDFIAARLCGEAQTTASGLSEGILWDFQKQEPSELMLHYFGFTEELLPAIVPTFGVQGRVSEEAASLTGLRPGTPISYRAGDQPNNAFSLNVLHPGEVAATAGTSGVIYGVSDLNRFDPQSRVNTFVHVNSTPGQIRNGILLCINGAGSMNAWVKKAGDPSLSYHDINELAAGVSPGSGELCVYPFGNGAERMLGNQDPGCSIHNLNFNVHTPAHLYRAAQEGVAFSLNYGLDIMSELGVQATIIRAGKANMFLSPVFCQTLADVTGATIELCNTDGSLGAARGAGLGAGIFQSAEEAFAGLKVLETVSPGPGRELASQSYSVWEKGLIR